MKAMVYTQYGAPDVLRLMDVAKPEPKATQVLVQVRAASVNALDYRRFEGSSLPGRLLEERLIKSIGKALGADISGQVAAIGSAVTRFRPGDEVFGVAAGSVGGFAEYACAPEDNLVLKPAGVSFEAAAAVPVAAITALQALRDKGRVQPGQTVLIHGASGGLGTFAVQLARALGARVTAVCSPRNLEIARGCGAERVIDYTREDFTKGSQRYDLILAINGYHPILAYRKVLEPGGTYLCAGGSLGQVLQAMLFGRMLSNFGKRRLDFMGIARIKKDDLELLSEMLENGRLRPVIDRSYPLDQVPDAIRYLLGEHAQGKVAISMS